MFQIFSTYFTILCHVITLGEIVLSSAFYKREKKDSLRLINFPLITPIKCRVRCPVQTVGFRVQVYNHSVELLPINVSLDVPTNSQIPQFCNI